MLWRMEGEPAALDYVPAVSVFPWGDLRSGTVERDDALRNAWASLVSTVEELLEREDGRVRRQVEKEWTSTMPRLVLTGAQRAAVRRARAEMARREEEKEKEAAAQGGDGGRGHRRRVGTVGRGEQRRRVGTVGQQWHRSPPRLGRG